MIDNDTGPFHGVEVLPPARISDAQLGELRARARDPFAYSWLEPARLAVRQAINEKPAPTSGREQTAVMVET